MAHIPFPHKSVNLLVGPNDIHDRPSAQLCYENDKELITHVQENYPDATNDNMEIPPSVHCVSMIESKH